MRRRTAVLFAALLVTPTLVAGRAIADCPPDQLFGSPSSYPSGQSPFHIAAADFNSDGVIDLAVTDNGGSDIGVLLGIGNGGFQAAATYAVNPGDGNLIVADLDRDGILDIVTNSSGTNTISVLKGHGDGTFAASAIYSAGVTPYGLACADFNGDGVPDIATANFVGNTVSILLGLPAGGFASPYAYPVGDHPYDVKTGDFNHDGIVDLVVTNQDGQDICIFLGQGTGGVGNGSFSSAVFYPVQLYPYSVAVADFNHDGIQDLAVANGGSGTVSILLGHGSGGVGDGTFGTAVSLSAATQPRSVVTGDFNRDGITDLAVADYGGSVSILFGRGAGGSGNGTFAAPLAFPAGSNPTDVAIGDFNGDTLQDLAVPNYLTQTVSVLIHGCGTPPPPPPSPYPTLTAVRDVPNDQGGRVFLTWLRSDLDGPPNPQITGYRVWRRIPPLQAALLANRSDGLAPRDVHTRLLPGTDGLTVTYWEALVTLPSEQLEGYGYTAPTTQDSMPGSNPYTAFFVTALTSNPGVFYESNVDSGYSVDNFAPARPAKASATYANGAVALHWASNREIDLDSYRVYRGTTRDFRPSLANLIDSEADTTLTDLQGGMSDFYKITAVDLHGNEGPAAPATPALATAVAANAALSFALRGATPNPSHSGGFTISFALPSADPASLEVFDLAGRRMWGEAVNGRAGTQTTAVGGSAALPAGVYLVQLTQGGRSATTRVVVSR